MADHRFETWSDACQEVKPSPNIIYIRPVYICQLLLGIAILQTVTIHAKLIYYYLTFE